MATTKLNWLIRPAALTVMGAVLPVSLANGQTADTNESALLLADRAEANESQQLILPVIRIERQNGQADLQGLYSNQTTDVNLGLEINPTEGLSLRANAWQLEDRQLPLQSGNSAEIWQPGLTQNYLENPARQDFALDQPFTNAGLESSGIDLGASYVWEAGNAGTFTLETIATYIHELDQSNDLTSGYALLNEESQLPGNSDLQGSVTLTWQFGNHSASAVTNYFDSFKDISELKVEDINQLVENITTFDLQYGYNVKTGKQDRAVISFSLGIRNIFDKKTTQILNQNSRVIDQNGRVAYGSIKYQF
ncbi:MAG: hypothetical protein KJN90_09035 [Gammaproteobacteria bacterium]|nr:hypothetical protein [Gammaproteobacteria bacterium]